MPTCDDGGVRRFVTILALVAVSLFGTAAAGGVAASAQSPDPSTDVTTVDGYDLVRPPSECIGFLPKPDCGREPVDAGERGGTLQYVTFGVILAGLAFIFTVVFRNVVRSDRAKAEQAYAAQEAVSAGPADPSRTPPSR